MGSVIEVPLSFRAQPRWWREGHTWLDSLPGRVDEQCRRWGLHLDGPPMHGSNALVVPVGRGGELFALRLTPPDDEVAVEIAALQFWDGRGMVRLVDADLAAGALLLERLNGTRSLQRVPLCSAAPIIGRLMRRLAVPAPADVRSTTALARTRRAELETDWDRLDRPFSRRVLTRAADCAAELVTTESTLAVNGDLHYEQVLAGTREDWLCVDPVLLRGDIEYDLGRILWYRLDELPDPSAIQSCFDQVVAAAELDPERARSWVFFRCVDYWLWGLDHGLTEDPVRCARLVDHFG